MYTAQHVIVTALILFGLFAGYFGARKVLSK